MELQKLATAHLMLTGNSGIGKTTLISNLIQRILSKKENRIIIFDISGSYINNSSLKDISNVYNRRLPINPVDFISMLTEIHLHLTMKSRTKLFQESCILYNIIGTSF